MLAKETTIFSVSANEVEVVPAAIFANVIVNVIDGFVARLGKRKKEDEGGMRDEIPSEVMPPAHMSFPFGTTQKRRG